MSEKKESLADRLRHPPRVLTHALRFNNEDNFGRTLEIISGLERKGPFEYHIIPRVSKPGVLLPEWSYKLLVPLLEEQEIKYREVTPIPVSGLPVEDQAKIRGRRRF